ncbi:MAG: hypothetical protein IJH07_02880 [Ruminococcus sp.]|nr:hypothetical protein [Ruminococcus sp.]
MGRSNKWTARTFIEIDGKKIPLMEIDSDGNIRQFVSDEEHQQYEQRMCQNMGEVMSRFYTAHPEYLKDKEEEDEQTKKPA